MSKYSEEIALSFVLDYISVKELLTNALQVYESKKDTHSTDCANTIGKAIYSFLREEE